MLQQQSTPQSLRSDHGHHVIAFPSVGAPHVQAESPAQLVCDPLTAGQSRVTRRARFQVAVLEAAGPLAEVAQELDRAIQLALAEGPRGVVCDLSGVREGADPLALDVLAMAGRHVRDWPGVAVAVASPDQRVRESLEAHPLGRNLIVTDSASSAVAAVLATPYLIVQCVRLAPHPTSPRAARDFVTRTLLDWRLSRVIPFASLVVGELVASSSIQAGTDIDLSVVWDRGALRLSVADHGPALSGQRPSQPHLHGRGRTVVAGISRSYGVLPTADGGRVVWAVLGAPRPSVRTVEQMSSSKPEPAKNASIATAI